MANNLSERNDLDKLNHDAKTLLQEALHDYDDLYGLGSMSNAVYDTAWVSMVTKDVNGSKQWLFPECFNFLLRTQLDDGGWESYASEVDGILNTAASLISLKRHVVGPLQMRDISLHELERQGVTFNFKGREQLFRVNASKLSRFKPAYLYVKAKTTALHSLEAFIGKIDFDQVRHHKVHGAMMASPSSTAAYLMHASTWDNEAENYLRHVVQRSSYGSEGGVPSAYPSTYFELSWILSTLLKSGYTAADFNSPELETAENILAQCFENEGGTMGFAPNVRSDVDDTAKGILTLKLLGINITPQRMVQEFEAKEHFRTYASERDPSLSANCNVLHALLHSDDMSRYPPQILKCVRFICACWWENHGSIKDKWNLSYLYPSMLLAEALVDFLSLSDEECFPGLLDQELKSRLSISLCQDTLRVMLQQRDNGSWNGSSEQTSYALLTLIQARHIAFFKPIHAELDSAIERGRAFLLSSPEHQPPEHLWIEKVSYTSPLLSRAYKFAALKASATQRLPEVGHELGGSSSTAANSQLNRLVGFYQRTRLFSETPSWQLRASLMEASLFRPLLQAHHLNIFPPRDGMEAPRYLELIPFTWTGCNNRTKTFASAPFLLEMMVLSMLNYQADEFMEAMAAAPAFANRLDALRGRIEGMFANPRKRSFDAANGGGVSSRERMLGNGSCIINGGEVVKSINGIRKDDDDDNDNDEDEDEDVLRPLSRFIAHTLSHPAVASASAHDAALVRRELRTFLLAHVAQADANARFHQAAGGAGAAPRNHDFFSWVRGPSADHTSCTYSFALMCTMLNRDGDRGGVQQQKGERRDCFPAAAQKYFAAALCRHLATMCRMYNDAGSVARDRAEGNLNGLDFDEFAGEEEEEEEEEEDGKKTALLELVEYERGCFEGALKRLQEKGGAEGGGEGWRRKMAVIRLFCDVTDLYGQVYIVKDMGMRMANGNGEGRSGSG